MNLYQKYFNLIEKLSKNKDIYAVYLFGKYAKNKQTQKSDLDICFVINNNSKELEKELVAHKNDELDISILSNLPINIQFDIFKTGKLIFINNKTKLKQIKLSILHQYKEESWVCKRIYKNRYGVTI